jgi:hypothetical protein
MLQRLGQSFNSAGVALFAKVALVGTPAVCRIRRGCALALPLNLHLPLPAGCVRFQAGLRLADTSPAPDRPNCSCAVQSDRPLALPHLSVSDIRWVDWDKLHAAGFEGCVFDKDNTLTEPYQLEVHPHAKDSLARCKAAFGGRLVLYSNSAGLTQFDPDGEALRRAQAAGRAGIMYYAVLL